MNPQELAAQRQYLSECLEHVIDEVVKIQTEMADLPHTNGQARRSLKHCSGQHVHSFDDMMMARYQAADGQLYRIEVHKL